MPRCRWREAEAAPGAPTARPGPCGPLRSPSCAPACWSRPVCSPFDRSIQRVTQGPLRFLPLGTEMTDFPPFPPLLLTWLLPLPPLLVATGCSAPTQPGTQEKGGNRRSKNLRPRIKIFIFFFFACAFQLFLKYLATSISN